MARGGIDFYGIGAQYATYEADTALKSSVAASGVGFAEGKAVVLTGSKKVSLGSSGNQLHGLVLKYENDDMLSVQFRGYAYFDGVSGSLPTAGTHRIAVVNGSGAVLASTSAVGRNEIVGVEGEKVIVLLG